MTGIIKCLLGISLVLSFATSGAMARYPHHHYRGSQHHQRTSAQLQQQRINMIHGLQGQVAIAREVLTNAESRSSMSQSQASEAMSKLDQIRNKMESAHVAIHQALEEVQLIEADILANQSKQSEFAVATQENEAASEEAYRIFHELSQTPVRDIEKNSDSLFVEMFELPQSEQSRIKDNSEYKQAVEKLKSTDQVIANIRLRLFTDNKEYKDAKAALDHARQESREQLAKSKPATSSVAKSNRDTNQLRTIAENAKLIIAEGELRLAQLGVKNSDSKTKVR